MNRMIDILAELGSRLQGFGSDEHTSHVVTEAIELNEWFSREDILMAVDAIREEFLCREKLQQWAAQYSKAPSSAAVAIIMAGNIPLVGFFDLMCTLMAGHRAALKPSSKDSVLTNYIISLLRGISPDIPICAFEPELVYDKVIATGGDEAARHFRQCYASIPSLIRGSRHSVAVLDGNESEDELQALQSDIFTYNGLGCRNVSLIFIPEGTMLKLCPPKMGEMYQGTYRHTKAMRTMLGQPYVDYGECIAVEESFFSPNISQINYCHYRSIEQVERWIAEHDTELQCIVSHAIAHPRAVAFGRAQYPSLADYADGVDVMKFLTE
jgi:acyl-CoA reductase-like NAD-dependent aldehyde dehydrogenase